MRRRRTSFWWVPALAALAGCADPVGVVDGDLSLVSESGGFVLENRGAVHDLTVTLVEQETLALIDLASCDVWTPRIRPGARLRVENDEVIGFRPDAETAVVYWCALDGERIVGSGSVEAPFS